MAAICYVLLIFVSLSSCTSALNLLKRQDNSLDVAQYIKDVNTALYVAKSIQSGNASTLCSDANLAADLDGSGYNGEYAQRLLCESKVGIVIFPDVDDAITQLRITLSALETHGEGAPGCPPVAADTLNEAGLNATGILAAVCQGPSASGGTMPTASATASPRSQIQNSSIGLGSASTKSSSQALSAATQAPVSTTVSSLPSTPSSPFLSTNLAITLLPFISSSQTPAFLSTNLEVMNLSPVSSNQTSAFLSTSLVSSTRPLRTTGSILSSNNISTGNTSNFTSSTNGQTQQPYEFTNATSSMATNDGSVTTVSVIQSTRLGTPSSFLHTASRHRNATRTVTTRVTKTSTVRVTTTVVKTDYVTNYIAPSRSWRSKPAWTWPGQWPTQPMVHGSHRWRTSVIVHTSSHPEVSGRIASSSGANEICTEES